MQLHHEMQRKSGSMPNDYDRVRDVVKAFGYTAHTRAYL